MRIFTTIQLERLPTKQLLEIFAMAQSEKRIWDDSKDLYDEDDCFGDMGNPWDDYVAEIEKIIVSRQDAKVNKRKVREWTLD